jgi:hypothetical protein
VLSELANRGRITRRPFENDPAVRMHQPGVPVDLEGAESFGPALSWVATDFAPLLLKRAIYIAGQINDIKLRGDILALADEVWDHVQARRISGADGDNLWDQPSSVFPVIQNEFDRPSWHHTVRVVESLVFASTMADSHPLRSDALAVFAKDLVAEAEHLLDQELLGGATESGRAMRAKIEAVQNRVERCREIMTDRPGSALALLVSVLRELDDLAAARSDMLRES